MLTLCDINKAYGDKTVLHGVSLHLGRGELAVLSGVSGGGKTTLMRIAAGLETPDGGTVTREGRLAVVFAEARLFPTVTVLENVTAVMPARGATVGRDGAHRPRRQSARIKEENEQKAMAILAQLGLADAATLYPHEISTGMAARVSLARAMASDADIYLLDEPLKSLDAEWKASVEQTLLSFFKDKAVLMISHDEAEAEVLATVRLTLADGRLTRKQ